MAISLVPNKDIAASAVKWKADQLLTALETNDEDKCPEKNGKKKNLDYIVLNSLNDAGAGFKYDTNKVAIWRKNGERKDFGLKSKYDVASDIIDHTMQ